MIRYTVQPGDTLWEIANRFRVTVGDIARYNGIIEVDEIFVGDVLRIPLGANNMMPKWHVVKPGESMFIISNIYGIPLTTLASLNPVQDINYIYPGQVLRLR